MHDFVNHPAVQAIVAVLTAFLLWVTYRLHPQSKPAAVSTSANWNRPFPWVTLLPLGSTMFVATIVAITLFRFK